MIPLFKTKIHEQSIKNAENVLRSGWVGLGPKVEEFENKFAEYIGNKYAVAFNSCTEALRAAIVLSNLQEGDGVITSPLTFVGVNHLLLQHQLEPIFADIDYITGSLSYNSIERLCKQFRPKAIIAMHYGGFPMMDMDILMEIAGKYDCVLIEDCAHAAGAMYVDGRKVGYNSKLAAFSFHAVKNMPIGDGGMLVTSDEEIANKAKKLRWFGIDKSTSERSKIGYGWEYGVEMVGFKSHMNDISAAIGLGQLERLDLDNMLRHNIYEKYSDELGRSNILFEFSSRALSSHHLMVLFAKHKEKVIELLTKNDIQYGVHYLPNYRYPMYKDFYVDKDGRNTERFYNECVSLPNHLYLTDDDIDKVIEVVKEGLR